MLHLHRLERDGDSKKSHPAPGSPRLTLCAGFRQRALQVPSPLRLRFLANCRRKARVLPQFRSSITRG
jgi:hypothetical protein